LNREASHLGIQGLVQTSIIPQKGDQRYGFFRFSTAFWWASIDWLNKQYCYVMLGVKEIFSEAPNLNLWPHKLNIWNPRLIIMIIISLILWCTNPTFKKKQVIFSPGSKRREVTHPTENHHRFFRLPVELDEILDLEMEAGDSIQWGF